MRAAICPSAAELRQLIDGQSSGPETAQLEEHVAGCASCLESLKREMTPDDTLHNFLTDASTLSGPSAGEASKKLIVATLMNRLEKLKPGGVGAATEMLIIACDGCGKKLKVKATLAGKKVKCPGCGQPTVARATGSAGGDQPPKASGNAPSSASIVEKRTFDASADTFAFKHTEHESTEDANELWDFLAPPQAPDEIGRLGSYRVLKVLGHGGMGVVFKAEDPALQRMLALKTMLPAMAASASAKMRFLREARAAAALKHDNIVSIYQVGEDRGAPFLAMEFLKGEPLDERLKRDNVLPLAEVLKIGREVAEGLAAAHDHGLIHRDIKPGNIWLEKKDDSRRMKDESKTGSSSCIQPSSFRCKILDFGLARSGGDQTNLTQSGAIVGTPAFMAPEQAIGNEIDHRCDLFSLGAMLYRLCTGELPFKGDSTLAILSSLAMANPRPPLQINKELPPAISDLIMKLLAKNPNDRPASAHEVVETLHALEAQTGQAAVQENKSDFNLQPSRTPTSKTSRVSPPAKRLVGLATLAVGLLAAIIAGVVFYFPSGNGTIRVEINDPDIEVALTATGIKIKPADGKGETIVTPGAHSLMVKRGDLEFETDKLVLKKGETATVKIEWLKDKLAVTKEDGTALGSKTVPPVTPPQVAKGIGAWRATPEQKAFLDALALVNESERRKAIEGKLAELHPNLIYFLGGFGSSVFEPKDEPAKTCRVNSFLREIWPLIGLPTLTSLDLTQTTVTDFSPLTHLQLTDVKLYLLLDNLASEEALKSMPTLKTINGQPAAEFWKIRAQVRQDIQKRAGVGSALSPDIQSAWLKGVLKQLDPNFEERYTYFSFDKATGRGKAHLHGVFDLAPLRALPVHDLSVMGHVCDLTPLIGTKITSFTCEESRVRDLAPLAGLPLKQLHLKGCLVDDLKPIAKLPLEEFTYRGMTPGEQSKIGMLTDITPLSNMPLKKLSLTFAEVNDLRPLAGMKLTELHCTGTRVIDLAPLKGQPLDILVIGYAGAGNRGLMGLPVIDLQPMAGLDLAELHGLVFRLYFEPDEKVLRGFARLKKINGKEPAAFWKVIDDLREKDKKFLDSVAQLAPEKAVEAVREEVRKRSPLYNGNPGKYQVALGDCTIRDNAVTEAIMWADWQADRFDPFAPLRAFPKLRKLTYDARDVGEADFSPLLTLPIEEIQCNERLLAYNRPVLRAMKHLKTINGKPATEFWKEVEVQQKGKEK